MRRLRHLVKVVHRGVTTVQAVLLMALVVVAMLAMIGSLGDKTSADMSQTATAIGDPSQMPARFAAGLGS